MRLFATVVGDVTMNTASPSANRPSFRVRRVLPDDPVAQPGFGRTEGSAWVRGDWPAFWISCPGVPSGPQVVAYRLTVAVARRQVVRWHVSADERYALYLDGQCVGRGSGRGSPWRWHYESFAAELAPGRHTLVARVWRLGDAAPVAQMHVREGFLLLAEGADHARWSTGVAGWTARVLPGYRFLGGPLTWGSGADEILDGRVAVRDWVRGRGPGWQPARKGPAGTDVILNADRIGQVHRLAPNPLPPAVKRPIRTGKVRQVEAWRGKHPRRQPIMAADHLAAEARDWQAWWQGATLRIPPHTARRAIIDLENYYCLYPALTVRGGRGAIIQLHWAESLYEAKPQPEMADDHLWSRPKGHRDQVEGKFFVGHGPRWIAPGGGDFTFDTLWWQSGRYVEILIRTGAEALTLRAPVMEETRYPLEWEGRGTTDDARLNAAFPVLVRGVQMCAHETYMDCPYWEQLMYVGDTRLQALCTYVMTCDDRLPRQALRLFRDSLLPNGLTQSRFPTGNGQIIPPFSLFWISMLHDFARWRGGPALVHDLLPGVRSVLDAHLQRRRADGLVAAHPGWNFVDWVPGWISGEPPGAAAGLSSTLMGLLVYALRQAADLEDYAGESTRAALWRVEAQRLAQAVTRTFWDERRGLMADDLDRTCFPEHTQCLALLGGWVNRRAAQRMQSALACEALPMSATIYFSHYVLEALAAGGCADGFYRRLELWKALPEQGFCTPYEAPGHTRSDCHAWGSHPLYHLYASVCGIQPADLGFRTVMIRPLLGPLKQVEAELVHPRGSITLSGQVREGRTYFITRLPSGLSGHLEWRGRRHVLRPGRQEFKL